MNQNQSFFKPKRITLKPNVLKDLYLIGFLISLLIVFISGNIVYYYDLNIITPQEFIIAQKQAYYLVAFSVTTFICYLFMNRTITSIIFIIFASYSVFKNIYMLSSTSYSNGIDAIFISLFIVLIIDTYKEYLNNFNLKN